jgi:23S rRNA (uracil1939-C5)-methyltransferase
MADTFNLELTAMAHGGNALGRHADRVIFVPYGAPGDVIRARITEDKGRFAFAEIEEIVQPSSSRTEPPCPHFGPGECGGCRWQHIDYPTQLEHKRAVVMDQLQRLGKVSNPPVQPTMPSPQPWGYRSYMTFAAAPVHNGEDIEAQALAPQLGFWSSDNSRVVPIEICHILHPALLDLYNQLELEAPEITRVKFQVGSDPVDRMLVIETGDDLPPEIELDLPVSVNFLLSNNEPVNLIGRSHVVYHVHGCEFRVTAGAFFQANVPVAEILVEQVMARLNLLGRETVLDLYSGVGLFTRFMAERAGLVISVESYPPAVTDADHNLADLENVEIIEGSVEAVLEDLEGSFDAVVVDPPRTGLSRTVIDELGRLAPALIGYVSCDPATLARDVEQLARRGYVLADVQPVDMFPQTFHVECVAMLRHTGRRR